MLMLELPDVVLQEHFANRGTKKMAVLADRFQGEGQIAFDRFLEERSLLRSMRLWSAGNRILWQPGAQYRHRPWADELRFFGREKHSVQGNQERPVSGRARNFVVSYGIKLIVL